MSELEVTALGMVVYRLNRYTGEGVLSISDYIERRAKREGKRSLDVAYEVEREAKTKPIDWTAE